MRGEGGELKEGWREGAGPGAGQEEVPLLSPGKCVDQGFPAYGLMLGEGAWSH